MYKVSLYNKIFFIFLIALLISISLIGYIGFHYTSEAYIDSAHKQNQESLNGLNLEIEKKLEYIPKNTLYLSNFYALKHYMIWKNMGENKKATEWKYIFTDAYLNFLNTQQDYYKIRILDVDGKEIINTQYDKVKENSFLHPNSELQDKSNKGYYKNAIVLNKEEFYFSEMNLNLEYGKITKPFVPVLRCSTPIVDANNEKVGILVVSFFADSILDLIKKKEQADEESAREYFLIDANGNYLYNANSQKQWNKQLKHGYNFNQEHFLLKEYIYKEKGSFFKDGKIYSYLKIYPLKSDRKKYWYLISSIDESVALAKLGNFKIMFMLVTLFVLLIGILVIRKFIKYITNPITKVTHQLKALSEGKVTKEYINYKAKDEIGEIVQSASKLVNAIEVTIEQANRVADGDFTKEIKLLSKEDELGLAIRSMTQRLKEITDIAQSLSVGDYHDMNIIVKSSEDKIGLALFNMVEYLKEITNIAESISMGDLNVKYKAKGADDRLGRAILQMIKYLRVILKHANAIAKEDFSKTIKQKSKDDELGIALSSMTTILKKSSTKNREEIFFSEGVGSFNDMLAGVNDKYKLTDSAISIATKYVNAVSGVIYTFDKESEEFSIISSYAYLPQKDSQEVYKLGEGVVGQVGVEKSEILLQNPLDNSYEVKTATAVNRPKEIYLLPIVHEGELFGVCEIMSLKEFSSIEKDYLKKTTAMLASSLYTVIQNTQIKTLLEKSQSAYEELQAQSEELQESNVQMEEQQQQLQQQSEELQEKNEILAQAKQEIDKRASDLEKASRYKSEFLANMSHELRTPLNSIILLSKLLVKNTNKTLSPKDVEKSSVINRAGNDLLYLINDILDLSKAESGNMELEEMKLSTSEIVDDLEGLFSVVAEEKSLDFKVEDNYKDHFVSDKTKLLQVLKNLLSNALKFTKEGSVELRIYKEDEHLIFEVKDTGIGIPEDKISSIFEAFKQVDGTISREFGGTGLGLSISKTIISLMHGELNVKSSYGSGSIFIVSIPLKTKVESLNSKPTVVKKDNFKFDVDIDTPDSTQELMGKNILLVDDDSRNIFTLTSTLERMDAEVFSAFNGKEALEALQNGPKIDLILMDIMMPVMDGIEAIKMIRADDTYKKIPIFAITAKNMPDDRDACLDAGADEYLSKPIDENRLISMLKAWIK
jgi:signal transduction histidine kinase/HAMP domain-containing protein